MARYAFRKSYSPTSARVKSGECSVRCPHAQARWIGFSEDDVCNAEGADYQAKAAVVPNALRTTRSTFA
jgi:hypothetical protein